jgi:transposase
MENTEKGTRKKYSKEFKLEAVRMLEAGEKGGHQIEKDLGIGSGQVYKWRKELAATGERAFPGNGTPRDEELMKLRKENASLREDREILRKALAMFSRPLR